MHNDQSKLSKGKYKELLCIVTEDIDVFRLNAVC